MIGLTTRHGPHQGAQKSTTTGVQSEDFGLKVGVGDFADHAPTIAGTTDDSGRPKAKLRYFPHRLEDDAAVIFEPPARRSAKTIGTSTTSMAGANRAIGGFDLERVALRSDAVQRKRLRVPRGAST